MLFSSDKAIYIQICEMLQKRILEGQLEPEARIPAVRDLSVELEVNPNTVVKSFTQLEEEGIIYKKRGLGYFVEKNALDTIKNKMRENFIHCELPNLARTLVILDIPLSQIEAACRSYSQQRIKE